jgi:hypothetical protein
MIDPIWAKEGQKVHSWTCKKHNIIFRSWINNETFQNIFQNICIRAKQKKKEKKKKRGTRKD